MGIMGRANADKKVVPQDIERKNAAYVPYFVNYGPLLTKEEIPYNKKTVKK